MSDQIRMFVPVAIRAIVDALAPRMRSVAEVPVDQMIDLNPLIYRRIVAGEAFDIGITNPDFVSSLAARGQIDDVSHHAFGTVALALGRRKTGDDAPVHRDGAGIESLLREAGTIASVGSGTSGSKYLDLLDRLQLSNSVGPKSIAIERGTAVPTVLSGRADLLAAPVTTVLAHPELELAGIVPDSFGVHIPLEIFVSSNPPAKALKLADFLLSSDLDTELASAGMLRPWTVHRGDGL